MLAAAALALAAVIGAGAAEAAKYAAIIVDADTQEVLHEVNADARTYPASLTKMMTLYLVFEALETGKLRTDQTLPVSAHAANRAPSKLGLVAGETVGVRDLILGLVTKSANDAASVIAEGLAGSEAAFAERMTQKARKLGMTNTVFRNASGLPDPGQVTTARDYSKLSIALYRDFPKHWHYFSTQTFSFRGRTFANHNHLMERFEGMDGIKTGFINASGFNLAASAVRNNRRLIGVVMGGESARGRDQHMAQLLNAAFATRRGTRSPTLMVDAAPQEGATQVAASSEDAEDAAPQPSLARRVAKSLNPIGTAEAAAPAASTRRLAEKGGWSLQLGAFTQKAAAHKAAADAAARLGKKKAVQVIAPAKGDKEKVFRARLTGFGKKDAQEACRQLHRKRHACVVVGPSA